MTKSIHWQAIIEATETMRQCADQQSWETVSQLAIQRDRLIRDFFARPLTVDQALQSQQDILELQAMDEAILGIARQTQQLTIQQQLGNSKGQKAARSYNDTAKL